MDTQRAKTLVINITTGVVVVAVLVTAYLMFFKKDSTEVTNITEAVETAEETIIIGTQVSRTLQELDELGKAVSESVQIFKTRAFRELENFSTEVPRGEVGRDNPFEPTVWKERNKELESRTPQRPQVQAVQTQPISTQTQSASVPSTSYFSGSGDYDYGI